MKQKCKMCGKASCNKKQIEIIRPWGRVPEGTFLFECMVGRGSTEILINRGIARYKKSASKKTNKSNGTGSKSKRSKRPSQD